MLLSVDFFQRILRIQRVIFLLPLFFLSFASSVFGACTGGYPLCSDGVCPNLGCFECRTCSDTMGNFYVNCVSVSDIPWCSVNSGSPCLPVPNDPRCSAISPPVCGDGVCNASEDCMSCSDDCGVCISPSVCGNGVAEGLEECDTGVSRGSCPAACSNSCTLNNCGPLINGVCAAPPHLGNYLTPPTGTLCTSGASSVVTSSAGFWNWDCVGSGGGSTASCWATVAPPPPTPPTLDLTINGSNGPLSVSPGDPLNFSWSVSNANTCTASGKWSGSKTSSNGVHIETDSAVVPSGDYILTCENTDGPVSDTVTINFTCAGSCTAWSACGPPCAGGNGQRSRTCTTNTCLLVPETEACTTTVCRDLNWKEVGQ